MQFHTNRMSCCSSCFIVKKCCRGFTMGRNDTNWTRKKVETQSVMTCCFCFRTFKTKPVIIFMVVVIILGYRTALQSKYKVHWIEMHSAFRGAHKPQEIINNIPRATHPFIFFISSIVWGRGTRSVSGRKTAATLDATERVPRIIYGRNSKYTAVETGGEFWSLSLFFKEIH